MKLLNRNQVLSANDLVFRDVPTPEWAPEGSSPEERADTGVRIRNLTGDGRGAFIQHSLEMKKKEDNKEKVNFEIEMLLIAMTAVDGENNLLFTREDVAALGQKNADVISRLATVAQELSGLDKKSQEAAAKNLQPAANS
jgi:hypothetical protein